MGLKQIQSSSINKKQHSIKVVQKNFLSWQGKKRQF